MSLSNIKISIFKKYIRVEIDATSMTLQMRDYMDLLQFSILQIKWWLFPCNIMKKNRHFDFCSNMVLWEQ